jgi:glycosyltransferase involved in cell wall biosynthesis
MTYLPAKCKAPVVTVCMLTFNHEKFIREAVLSVLEQKIPDLVILIADDGSKDHTKDICIELQKKYSENISLILHKKNLGIAKNIETMYEYIIPATKYISWFSGDDIFFPNKLNKQIRFMEKNPGCIMCYHDVLVRDDKSGVSYRYNDPMLGQRSYAGNIFGKLIVNGCFISGLSTLVRWQKFQFVRHNTKLGYCNDWPYFIELAHEGKIGYIDEVLGIYRRHLGNVTRSIIDSKAEEKILLYLKKKYGASKFITKGLIRLHASYFFKFILLKDFSAAKRQFVEAVSLSTQSFDNFIFLFRYVLTLICKRIFLLIKTKQVFR